MPHGNQFRVLAAIWLLLFFYGPSARAQVCSTPVDMDPASKTALESAAQNYALTARQGSATLQANAEFNLGDIVETNRDLFAGQASVRQLFLLDNSQPTGTRAEFFCGIYNSPDRVTFVFNGLPAGKFGVVIQDVTGKTPGIISWILHQQGAQWKIAGLYPKPGQTAGHDAAWYLSQARAYRAKGQALNAWLYYLVADNLQRPFPSMSTPKLEKLYDEIQQTQPKDVPVSGPVDLVTPNAVYKVTELFPTPVGEGLDVVVKYQAADISDSNKTFQQNMAVIKALVAKYPELRQAFAGVVARAVAPNGQDYGSLLAMKDVK